MAIELLDEHEQSELVRNWLKQNAISILIGVAVGLAAVLGWYQWRGMSRQHTEQAQMQYRDFVEASEASKTEDATRLADELRAKFADTPYGVFVALRQSQDAMKKGDLKAAADALTWAREKSKTPALKQLVALRLARVKLALDDAGAALSLSQEVGLPGYKALAADVRGDALVALKRNAEALTAYEEALAGLDASAPQRSFIEMKRDDLITTPTPTPKDKVGT
jgi:predicted negative regulator of RcsB-dependent stress response